MAGREPWPAFGAADAYAQDLGAQPGPLAAPDQAPCDRVAAFLNRGRAAP